MKRFRWRLFKGLSWIVWRICPEPHRSIIQQRTPQWADVEMTGQGRGEWSEIASVIAKRFELAAHFGGNAVHSPQGSAAIASVIREMGKKLDLAVARSLVKPPTDSLRSAASSDDEGTA